MKYILGLLGLVAVFLVLFPLFSRGKVGRHHTSCLSNMKQSAVACIMYSTDNDERFPLRDSWMDELVAYTKRESIFRCPQAQGLKPNDWIYGYSLNRAMAGVRAPAKANTTVLLFDSLNMGRNASGDLHSLPRPGRHKDGNFVAYADGHAKWISDQAVP